MRMEGKKDSSLHVCLHICFVSREGCITLHLAWRLEEKDDDSLGNLGNKMQGDGR